MPTRPFSSYSAKSNATVAWSQAARLALDSVDAREASKVADPQAAAIARFTGLNEDGVRTARHALIAVLFELDRASACSWYSAIMAVAEVHQERR
jgi:hypothetical protein